MNGQKTARKEKGGGVVYYLTFAGIAISDKLRSAKSELVPEVGIPSLLQDKLTDTGWRPRGILSEYSNLR